MMTEKNINVFKKQLQTSNKQTQYFIFLEAYSSRMSINSFMTEAVIV